MFPLIFNTGKHHSHFRAEHSSKAAHPLSLVFRPYIMQFFLVSNNEYLPSRSLGLSPGIVPGAYKQELAAVL
jgi:hypothetical protein